MICLTIATYFVTWWRDMVYDAIQLLDNGLVTLSILLPVNLTSNSDIHKFPY